MPSKDQERRDALPVGTVLRDFTVREVIGHGGFGVVYRAGHNELDLTVAIKEYLPVELAVREGSTVRPRSGTVRRDFEDGLRRFRDEAQVLVGFDNHPSIVSCRDFFRENGTAYLVMAFEDGRSLAEVLASREAEGRPFTEWDLRTVMTPVLEGLARVHATEVLHRDIKPSNILIRRADERPVLIDFGAAKQATARFTKSLAPYTEGYAALEQVADSGKLGPWTDMYGVGAVMWRMVAGGNRPWEPPHPVRVEQRSHAVVGATVDPMPSASELGKGRFPPQMLGAIDRCLRLRESERVQSASELLEAIRAGRGLSTATVSVTASGPSAERAVGVGHEGRSGSASAVLKPRARWSRVGGLVASSLVGLGLALSAWWSLGTLEWSRDQGPDGISDASGGPVTDTKRGQLSDSLASPNQHLPSANRSGEANRSTGTPTPDPTGAPADRKDYGETARGQRRAVGSGDSGGVVSTQRSDVPDSVANSSQRPAKRELPQEASGTVRSLEPNGAGSGHERELSEAEGVRDTDSRSKVPPERSPPEDRGSLPEAIGTTQTPDPTGTGSGRDEELFEVGSEQASDGSPELRPEQPQDSFVRPWIHDWENLGNIRDPGFADRAQAYITRYGKVAEASAWVAKAEGLLAQPRELETANRPLREAGASWTNSLEMEFAWIPAGSFLMGSPPYEGGRNSDERQYQVRISEGFWMQAHEVTQGEWEAVMGQNPSHFKECGPRCPVEKVSWHAALEYIGRLNVRESGRGYRYRLPTEAEWEYSARAGTTGVRYGVLDLIAWYGDNSGRTTHPVGQKRANSWGLHDMLGNISEWTANLHGQYPTGLAQDPGSPRGGWWNSRVWKGRVARGGGWNQNAIQVRSANRDSYRSGYRNRSIGFRLVRTK